MAEAGPRLYMIAGEPSGDRLGGALLSALRDRTALTVHGVGGRDMAAAGLTSLFDMADLTVMGLSEVLPRLPTILKRIRQTADDVIARRPDALITVDSPDFTLRVAKRARATLPGLKVIHYVAPSVWAWRPGRAAKMARHVDHVLALLPFEPPFMEAAGMSCDFVGHPVAGRAPPGPEAAAAFRAARGIAPGQKALLMAPGSRKGEVRRLMADFLAAVAALRRDLPDLAVIVPLAETVEAEVRAALATLAAPVHPVAPDAAPAEKAAAMAAADAALCASGTITLEMAAAGTPMVAAYKASWLTAAIVRRVALVNSANLINLISGQVAVPELLQEFCTPAALMDALWPLLTDPAAAKAQRATFAEVMAILGRGGPAPEMRAAESVLAVLAGARPRPVPGPMPTDIRPGPAIPHAGRRDRLL